MGQLLTPPAGVVERPGHQIEEGVQAANVGMPGAGEIPEWAPPPQQERPWYDNPDDAGDPLRLRKIAPWLEEKGQQFTDWANDKQARTELERQGIDPDTRIPYGPDDPRFQNLHNWEKEPAMQRWLAYQEEMRGGVEGAGGQYAYADADSQLQR